MNLVKKLLALLTLGVMTISLTACGNINNVTKELLFEKYNKEFEVKNVQGGGIFSGYTDAIAYPADNEKFPFMVHVDGDKKGLSDNYVSRIICEEMSDIIEKNLEGLKGKVYVHSAMTIENWILDEPNLTIKEYLNSNPEDRFVIYVAYSPSEDDKENYYENLTKMFNGIEEVDGNVRLYNCDDGKLLDMQEYFENNDKAYDDFNSMCSPYYLGKVGVKNGKLESSKEEILEMYK